jgi:hypothetical protein
MIQELHPEHTCAYLQQLATQTISGTEFELVTFAVSAVGYQKLVGLRQGDGSSLFDCVEHTQLPDLRAFVSATASLHRLNPFKAGAELVRCLEEAKKAAEEEEEEVTREEVSSVMVSAVPHSHKVLEAWSRIQASLPGVSGLPPPLPGASTSSSSPASAASPSNSKLRFKVGDKVEANLGIVPGNFKTYVWKRGTVMKHWDNGKPYRIQLENGRHVWAAADMDLWVRPADMPPAQPSSSNAPTGSSQTALSVSSRLVPVGTSEQQMLQTAIEALMGGKAAATAAAAAQAKGGGEVIVIDDSEDEASSKDAASKAQTSARATVHDAHLALEASGRLVGANHGGGASQEAEGPSSGLSGERNAGKRKLRTDEAQIDLDPAQEQEAVSRRQEEKAAAAAAAAAKEEKDAKIVEEEACQLANAPRQAGAPWGAKALLRFEQGEQGPVPDMPNTFELDSSQTYVIGRQASHRFSKELCILTFTQ